MGFEQHYNTLNALHEQAPWLIKKVTYEAQFYVVVNHFRPKIADYMEMTHIAEEFRKLERFYENKKFTSDVEEFHVSSAAGNNIFIAAFSDNGVDSDSASTVLRRTSFNLFDDRVMDANTSPVGAAQSFWLTTQRWQNFNNEPVNILDDNSIVGMADMAGNGLDKRFMLELFTVTPESMHPIISEHRFGSMEQIFDAYSDGAVGIDFVNRIVSRFWLWNDQYFYTEFSEPYRHLLHPFLPPKSDFTPALKFNIKANSLGKNVNTAVFIPYIINIGEQFGLDEPCTRCGGNGGGFIKTGYNVQTVEKLCADCSDDYHNVCKGVIKHTADYPSEASSIYSLLLADEMYGVLNEKQLISLALEFPDFSEQIIASRNSTENVRSALALNRKQRPNYV